MIWSRSDSVRVSAIVLRGSRLAPLRDNLLMKNVDLNRYVYDTEASLIQHSHDYETLTET